MVSGVLRAPVARSTRPVILETSPEEMPRAEALSEILDRMGSRLRNGSL